MKMREIMRPPSWTVREDDPLGRAERIMSRHRIRTLPVLDSGKLVGVVSERDILAYRAKTQADEDWWLAPVSSAMQMHPATAVPEEAITRAADHLAASPEGILPVVAHGFLVGIVTATDVLDADRASRALDQPVTAADAMSELPVTVAPTDSLIEAAGLMVDNQIRHLPVVDKGVVVGMLSDRDIRDLAGDPVRFVEARDADASSLSVRDAMTTNAKTVTPDRSLLEIAEALADGKIGAVPVIDEDGRPIGIVSYVDVLRALAA
jgi:CBS domain-containing protein